FNYTPGPDMYTLSLHVALPISTATSYVANRSAYEKLSASNKTALATAAREISGALRQHILVADTLALKAFQSKGVEVVSLSADEDRKSTRLNSSHVKISYAVFC